MCFVPRGVCFVSRGVCFVARGVCFVARGVCFVARGVCFVARGVCDIFMTFNCFAKHPSMQLAATLVSALWSLIFSAYKEELWVVGVASGSEERARSMS